MGPCCANCALVDGTFELFRYFLSPAAAFDRSAPPELRAVRGVVGSILGMLEGGATHVGVATDHVIESFRNALWAGYKTGDGIDPLLLAQFEPLEDALRALGVVVWAMVEFEADDALAAAAAMAERDQRVEQVVVCTPDKDLSQCVRGGRVIQLDRRTREVRDEEGVRRKFGVAPASIPDWLALVGDSADGYPGLPGWGAKSAAAVLRKFGRLVEFFESDLIFGDESGDDFEVGRGERDTLSRFDFVEVELLRAGRLIKTLDLTPSPPLGLRLADAPPAIGEEALEPGDMLLLYTDGFTEARRPDGERSSPISAESAIRRSCRSRPGCSASQSIRRAQWRST